MQASLPLLGGVVRWRVDLYAGFCPDPCGSVAAIPLGRRLPAGSSGLPGGLGACAPVGRTVLPLSDLAPGGVCRAARVAPGAGALLPHRFTLACACRHAIGGLFSVALSCGSPRLGVTQHPVLRSPDVPRTGRAGTRPPGRLATATPILAPARTQPHRPCGREGRRPARTSTRSVRRLRCGRRVGPADGPRSARR
jgi:hypothetical protein